MTTTTVVHRNTRTATMFNRTLVDAWAPLWGAANLNRTGWVAMTNATGTLGRTEVPA